MKCQICDGRFSTKGQVRCSQIPPRICEKCSIEGKSSHSCDLTCKNTLLPKIDYDPTSTSIIGFSPSGQMPGTVDEYMPRAFHFISAEGVIKISFKNMFSVHVTVAFTLTGNKSLEKQVFKDEYWKLRHIKDALKNSDNCVDFIPVPIVGFFLNNGLRVISGSEQLKIGGKKSFVISNDAVDFVAMPDSYPPKYGDKQKDWRYSYYIGKFASFYTTFKLNKEYVLEFDLEVLNFYYTLGFLFPYRFVELRSFSVGTSSEVEIAKGVVGICNPIRAAFYPPKQEYELKKRFSFEELMPPAITPADPFRDLQLHSEIKSVHKFLPGQNFAYSTKDYTVFQTQFAIKKPDRNFIYNVQTTNSPLPVRVYQQMQKLPHYRDFLIYYDLLNFSDQDIDLEITSRVEGFTSDAISNVVVPRYGGSSPSRKVLSQCPILKPDALINSVLACEATLFYQIRNKETGSIEKGTKIIKLLSNDTIIWKAHDARSSMSYDLSYMLGAWVTPNDKEGLLDAVRGGAKKYHPSGTLVGSLDETIEEQTSQVKALYEYLNQETEISYVNQQFSFNFGVVGQRVLLPERVLKAKAGNCIDLTVLFASLLEGLGINPLIMLMPGHAFLGWGDSYDKERMDFLECTCLGVNSKSGDKISFEEAQNIARKEFKDNFFFIGSDDVIPNSLLLNSKGAQIVDLSEIRKEGIYRKAS